MKNITNELPTEKLAAKIIVDGLFVFCLNEKQGCAEFGVYEFAEEHEFSIQISKRLYGFGDKDEDTSLVGESLVIKPRRSGAQANNISISMKNRRADLAVYCDLSLGEEVFLSDPTNLEGGIDPESEKYKHDFRWIIDLEGKHFHNRKLDITPGTLDRKIKIFNGVMATHDVAPRLLKSAFPVAAGPAKRSRACYVGFQLAIDLPKDTVENVVAISYGNSGSAIGNEVLLTPSSDYYYEIRLTNNCQKPEERVRHFSDFQNYYNVFAKVPIDERLDFDVKFKGAGDILFPCDLVFLSEHDEL